MTVHILTWVKGVGKMLWSAPRVEITEQLLSIRDQKADHIKSLLRGVSDDFDQVRKEIRGDTSH